MDISREEFEALKTDMGARFTAIERSIQSSYESIAKYLTGNEKWLDERLSQIEKTMDERFHKVDERFDKMDDRFDKMDIRFDRLEKRFDSLHQEVRLFKQDFTHSRTITATRFDAFSAELKLVNQNQMRVEERVDHLEQRVFDLERKETN